jgi:5-(carboxyamino)imidazole ribonucleotide mutase
MNQDVAPLVGVIMGSKSDWETMAPACEIFEEFEIPYEKKVLSAHRTPELAAEFAQTAEERGMRVIIAGAGGSAHLPGMVASLTHLPVLGVPVKSRALSGLDSLLSIVQMPGGVPVASLSIGPSGAKNAALMSVRMLATSDAALREKLGLYLEEQKRKVIENSQL